MVEPAQHLGTIIFAAAIAAMVICAGVASFPPARDSRVFAGAAVLSGAWVAMLAAQKFFNSWNVTSSFFILDFVYLVAFYWISRPTQNKPKADWAGYIVAILAIIIALEIMHFISIKNLFLEPFILALLGLVSAVILFGFVRGFGLAPALCFAVAVLLINITALKYYAETNNVLTFSIILIIFVQGARGAWKNISSWTKPASTKSQSSKR